jgi:hypothetical protein
MGCSGRRGIAPTAWEGYSLAVRFSGGGWGEPIEPAMGQCDGGRRCAARAVLGARTRGEWGRDECGEVGVSPRPLIGGRGGVEASSGEGIGRRWQ